MDISEIFSQFAEKMTQIALYQRAMHDLTKRELEYLSEYANGIKEAPESDNFSYLLSNMYFSDAHSGKFQLYGQKTIKIKDQILAVYLHKNKQYRWLLVEAFEEFQIFLEMSYAYAGMIDKNFWPLSDFGNISLNDIESKTWHWYQQQVRNKRDKPQSILTRFRSKFPELEKIEKDNAFKINLRLALALIEQLRHFIVHKGGVVGSRIEFINLVLKKAGLSNNGNPKQEYVAFIEQFFGAKEFAETIRLIEIRVMQAPIEVGINPHEILTGYLLSYAHFISEQLKLKNNMEKKSIPNK